MYYVRMYVYIYGGVIKSSLKLNPRAENEVFRQKNYGWIVTATRSRFSFFIVT